MDNNAKFAKWVIVCKFFYRTFLHFLVNDMDNILLTGSNNQFRICKFKVSWIFWTIGMTFIKICQPFLFIFWLFLFWTKHLSEFNFNSRFVVSELVAGSGGQQCKIRKMGNCLQIFLWSTFALFGKWIFFWSMHISVIILCQHDSIMSVQIKILFSTLFLYSMLQNFHVKISIIQK